MTTLENDFHGTEYTARKTEQELSLIGMRVGQGYASKSEKALRRKIWKRLCGMDECRCGDVFGARESGVYAT